MKEIKIHNVRGHPEDLHVDEKTFPLAAYLVLTAIPADPPASMFLSYGNSELIGKLLMTFFERCVVEQPEMAYVLEQVSRSIVGIVEAEKRQWPNEISKELM